MGGFRWAFAALLVLLCSRGAAAAACEFVVSNEWGTGFNAAVSITNDGAVPLDGWSVTLDFGGAASVSNVWNGQRSGSAPVVVEDAGYNARIAPGATVEFGLQGSKALAGSAVQSPLLGGHCDEDLIASPPEQTPGEAQCTFSVVNEWGTGYTAAVRVANVGQSIIDGWRVELDFDGEASIANAWNASVSGSNPALATNVGYNTVIVPGAAVEFGFNAAKRTPGTPASDPLLGGVCLAGEPAPPDPDPVPDPQPERPTYRLDPALSSLHFVSTKQQHVVETHRFATLAGAIDADGSARLEIDLDSVDSGIEIRDARMVEHLFDTATHGGSSVTVAVEPKLLNDLEPGSSTNVSADALLALHGATTTVEATLRVTRLDASRVLVRSAKPVLVDAVDFGLDAGIETLREIAGLTSISYAVPVNFTLLFEQVGNE